MGQASEGWDGGGSTQLRKHGGEGGRGRGKDRKRGKEGGNVQVDRHACYPASGV